MRLRARLALTTAALLVPLAALLAWGEGEVRARTARDLLESDALAGLDDDAHARCEASPEAWAHSIQSAPPPFERPPPGPPPPTAFHDHPPRVHLYPFDEQLHPSVPFAPPLDLADRPHDGHEAVLLRAPWRSGRCAWILAVRPAAAPLFFLWRPWVATLGAVLLAMILVLGPTVARIRALAVRVRASSSRRAVGCDTAGNDEIEDLATAFDDAAREVRAHVEAQERREQTLREFLANTTHDVMTPLTVLQGHLAALRDAAEGSPTDRSVLRSAMDEAVYMTSLVHNLGVAARLEGGEPHLARTTVDLGALVERCVGRHRPIAKEHAIEIACAVPETPIAIEGDETFLEQALSNLVLNAIRHNRAGGHVAVVLGKGVAGTFRVRVVDDGTSLSDDDLALLQATSPKDAGAKRGDGHGLGIAIARRVAALHDQTLTFTRAEGGGLCVDLEDSRR